MDDRFNYSFFLERLKKIVDLREKIFNYSSLFFFVFVLSEIIFCKKKRARSIDIRSKDR